MITVKNYLSQAQALLDSNEYTDGCSLTQFMHKILSKAKILCAAHDYGGLGKIDGVRAGWHNNLHNLLAHFSQSNPFYWLWGIVVFIFTMPWVVWKRDLKMSFPQDASGFYIFLMFACYVTWMITGAIAQVD